MEVATETVTFLDLKLKFDKESKQISVDVFAKGINTFTHVFCSPSFIKTKLKTFTFALRRRRVFDSSEKFEKHSTKYQNYLIARDYRPGKVKKQFSDIKKLTKEEPRKLKLRKTTFSTSRNLISLHIALLPNLKNHD